MKHFSLLALVLAACQSHPPLRVGDGGTDGDGGTSLTGLSSIDVSPPTTSLTVTNGVAATSTFTAMGHFSDGHTADVTSQLTWSLVDSGIGTIAAGAFTSSIVRGGKTSVTATTGTLSGTAALTVKWVSTRGSTDDGSSAPATSAAQFAAATTPDTTLAPAVLYPNDGVVVPLNLGELEVQWSKPTGKADLYEVALLADTLDLRLYTNAPETTGGRLSLLASEWTAVSQSVAGQTLTVKVTGMASATPTASGASAVVKMTIDPLVLNGGIYYWSPTHQGIERAVFGDTMHMASDFFSVLNSPKLPTDTPPNSGACVACHVVSRDGKKATVTYDGGAGGGSSLLDVATVKEVIPQSKGLLFDFASFSPDSSKVIAAHQTGTLTVYDSTSGTVLGSIPPPDTTSWLTQPDWSADGKSLVYVKTLSKTGDPYTVQADWQFFQGSIYVMTGPGDGTFSNPTLIVAPTADENNYYPSFSPDGKWILYNHVRAGLAGASVSYNCAAAEPYVVSSDGKIGPFPLTAASATGDITNSWPRWAPFVQTYADGSTRMYFTFSSKRNYGIELIQPTNLASARPQIWMSAFSPAAAMAKTDPSSAPFWLPFQDLTTDNHIAQWTQAVVGLQ